MHGILQTCIYITCEMIVESYCSSTPSMAALFFFLLFLVSAAAEGLFVTEPSFDENYVVTWGEEHVKLRRINREIDLSLDYSSGSAFGSKKKYGSGLFHLRMKLPERDSAGVVTAFYLSSNSNYHDELDFEFLGNREGEPYIVQTNVFADGVGNREQRIHLWFDPTEDFHSYRILWNPTHVVFFVDKIPVRVFKNNTNIGVSYPSQPMQIIGSIWDGESWATDGGMTKTNWSDAPFVACFREFGVDGCEADDSNIQLCSSSSNYEYWWNDYTDFTGGQQHAFQSVKKYQLIYDYCSDKTRYPTAPPECDQ